MSDPREKLQEKFRDSNRFSCFGDMILKLSVQGFRCHKSTTLLVESPITAFCGLNGTGKSTLLQLSAVGYRSQTAGQSYSISDFLVRSALDPTPYGAQGSVKFEYASEKGTNRQLTITRNQNGNRWNGYRRRPVRTVLFAGIGLYLPKVETRDFIIRGASHYTVDKSVPVTDHARDWTCKILGHNYDQVTENTVKLLGRTKKVISVQRHGFNYSETHMGFGEGRAQFMIDALEGLPDRSLVLLEEPETSLHQRAQYAFGGYLVDVAIRKGHQVLLSTHSDHLLRALPSASLKFLCHAGGGIQQLTGVTAAQANSLLTDGYEKALTVLVEDSVAKAILVEILALADESFRRTVNVCAAGDRTKIAEAVRTLKATGLKVAAVRDGDVGPDTTNFIFKLPGTQPPEKEILDCSAVRQYIQNAYSASISDLLAANPGADHHTYFGLLASSTERPQEMLVGECARLYAASANPTEITSLVDQLKDAANR